MSRQAKSKSFASSGAASRQRSARAPPGRRWPPQSGGPLRCRAPPLEIVPSRTSRSRAASTGAIEAASASAFTSWRASAGAAIALQERLRVGDEARAPFERREVGARRRAREQERGERLRLLHRALERGARRGRGRSCPGRLRGGTGSGPSCGRRALRGSPRARATPPCGPAASPSKQNTTSSASRRSFCTCAGVVAVPSVATAFSTPCCASATTSM